jgi:hypothetical protein
LGYAGSRADAVALDAAGISVECRNLVAGEIEVALKDLGLEPLQLTVALFLVDIKIPSLRSSVRAIVPTITAALELVLEVVRRILGPDADRLAPRLLQECGERGSGCAGQRAGENFEEGLAIVDGTVGVMEAAHVGEQVSELGAAEPIFQPIDLSDRASPVPLGENGPCLLGEGAVELGVMCDDDVGVGAPGDRDQAFRSIATGRYD